MHEEAQVTLIIGGNIDVISLHMCLIYFFRNLEFTASHISWGNFIFFKYDYNVAVIGKIEVLLRVNILKFIETKSVERDT